MAVAHTNHKLGIGVAEIFLVMMYIIMSRNRRLGSFAFLITQLVALEQWWQAYLVGKISWGLEFSVLCHRWGLVSEWFVSGLG